MSDTSHLAIYYRDKCFIIEFCIPDISFQKLLSDDSIVFTPTTPYAGAENPPPHASDFFHADRDIWKKD